MSEMKVLMKLEKEELILIIQQEKRRINELEKRIKNLDKIWRNYYRGKQYKK